jgi:hypothetical protein
MDEQPKRCSERESGRGSASRVEDAKKPVRRKSPRWKCDPRRKDEEWQNRSPTEAGTTRSAVFERESDSKNSLSIDRLDRT